MPTIRDVARRARVSISTVSLALNRSGPVSAETERRVWDAAREVGYTPNALAQSLKIGRSRLIGMVVGDLANPFFGTFTRVVERIARSEKHMLIVAGTDGDIEREGAIVAHLRSLRVAGVIINPMGAGEAYLASLRAVDLPMVAIDQKVEGLDRDFIASDNELASNMLAQHLVRLGHRRISHISGTPGLWTSEMRVKGFRDAMRAARIPVDESLQVSGDYQGETAYEQALRLLARPDRPSAIMAANNVMALGVLQAIFDLGLDCPRDVSLVSIDDVPWSGVIRPRLTMVVQHIDRMAETACRWLLERIAEDGRVAAAPRELLLTPRLVPGDSCAPPAPETSSASG